MKPYASEKNKFLVKLLEPTCNKLNKSTNEIDKLGIDEIEEKLTGFETKKPKRSIWSKGGYSKHNVYNVLGEKRLKERRKEIDKFLKL